MAYEPDLDLLLTDGYRPDWKKRTEVVIECHELAPAVMPTGRLLASDGYPTRDDEPFAVTVPPGTYPMYAWVAVFSKHGKEIDRRCAALELRVGDGPVIDWEMARAEDEKMEDLENEEDFFGFDVESGRATITDVATCEALWQWDFSRYESVFIPKTLPERPVPRYVSAVVDAEAGANLTVVGSGWGDGAYPAFIGRDENGDITSFVTDFMLFEK